MTVIVVDKPLDLSLLSQQLTTAGITHRGLGITAGQLHTYAATGIYEELPEAAVAVYSSHVPASPPPTPDYGSDDTPRSQVAAAVQNLRDYLALSSPTNAQTVAAFKLSVRVLLFVLKRIWIYL